MTAVHEEEGVCHQGHTGMSLIMCIQEVLFLDADSFPMVDPAQLFTSDAFAKSGAVFWQDYWDPSAAPEVWRGSCAWGVCVCVCMGCSRGVGCSDHRWLSRLEATIIKKTLVGHPIYFKSIESLIGFHCCHPDVVSLFFLPRLSCLCLAVKY